MFLDCRPGGQCHVVMPADLPGAVCPGGRCDRGAAGARRRQGGGWTAALQTQGHRSVHRLQVRSPVAFSDHSYRSVHLCEHTHTHVSVSIQAVSLLTDIKRTI